MTDYRIDFQGQRIGDVRVSPTLDGLDLKRTLRGYSLEIPVSIKMVSMDAPNSDRVEVTVPQRDANHPVATQSRQLAGVLERTFCKLDLRLDPSRHDSVLPIATSELEQPVRAGRGESWQPVWFRFDLGVDDILRIETLRNSRDVSFGVHVTALAGWLVDSAFGWRSARCELALASSQSVIVAVPAMVWTTLLRKYDLTSAFLVELPKLPVSTGSPWTEIAECYAEAHRLFESGNWNQCVGEVRKCFDAWRTSDGSKSLAWTVPPTGVNPSTFDKTQRLEHLRYYALQFCHKGPHTPAKNWSRHDALLAMSLLTGLLNALSPQDVDA